jgi:hypothetical protein
MGRDVDVLATRVTDLRKTQCSLAGEISSAMCIFRIGARAANDLLARAIALAGQNPFASVYRGNPHQGQQEDRY